MKKKSKAFPEAVAAERKRLGVSQSCLGARLGVSGQTIWRWESGRQLPTEPMQALFIDAIRRLKREDADNA